MLRELELELKRNHNLEEVELKKAASSLMSKQFIYRFNGYDRNLFLTIKGSQDYFTSLFDALGHKLVVDNDYGYIGIIPEFNFRTLKLIDTLLLLVARLIYDEEMKSMRSSEDVVSISHESFLMRYEKLTGRDRPENISKLHEHITVLQRYGVLKSRDSEHEPSISIYPGIMSLLNADTIRQIEDFNHVTATEGEEA